MERDRTYQSAERKIEDARRSEATTLDLSTDYSASDSEKLTELPATLAQLTWLQSLDLSGNELTILPDWLGGLTQLQSLDLSGNRLRALPERLSQVVQLYSLDLSVNELVSVPKWLGRLTKLQSLNVSGNELSTLPEWLFQLTQLRSLNVSGNELRALPARLCYLVRLQSLNASGNELTALPETFNQLTCLQRLDLSGNNLTALPKGLGQLAQLHSLKLSGNDLSLLPDSLGELTRLESLGLSNNELTTLPESFARLPTLRILDLDRNPLNPELAAAYADGFDAIKRYLRANAESQVALNEAKLILIGEGEVGKTCLLSALRGDDWLEGRPTTHGIEIKPVIVTDSDTGINVTLNGWDFGGQRVYRPTHQLFFSAPAVYLVVWKPREGPHQGFVKEWIKLVKHREPDAKILVVATHGGPGARQPDIDRQEIWDLFGKETVIDFFYVDSRPPNVDKETKKRTGTGRGIEELKRAIARVATGLPEMGRGFPERWQNARLALRECQEAYLPLDTVFAICRGHQVEGEDARLLLRICRHVGDLIHFEHDPTLRDIVVLKPDWLATAISFVLDDEQTRQGGRGLVKFSRLGELWNDPKRKKDERYASNLHPVFLRLMERFDLSYRVAEPDAESEDGTSLIAQLVPDVRPDSIPGWSPEPSIGDAQQVQICRIVETANNQSANAEGLFYQLIVRLHKYSLGRIDHRDSVHWQRGLILEDDTGARAFLEHVANDVRITVRSPYPERFLSALTYEVQWLVESFWEGLRCEVTVPCLTTEKDGRRCNGLFDVKDLLDDLRNARREQKCSVCKKWHSIEQLLRNAPAAQPNPMAELLAKSEETLKRLEVIRGELGAQHIEVIGRFDRIDAQDREIVSKVEAAYTGLMHSLLSEAKEGPRLFSFKPVGPGFLDRPKWMSAKVRVTLWCEHSRRPLWQVCGDPKAGVYTINIPREWLIKSAPFLKLLSTAVGLILPVVAAGAKVALPEPDYKAIEAELVLGKSAAESLLKGGEKVREWRGNEDSQGLDREGPALAHGAALRQLHAWLKEQDPSFGGLVRVQNRRHEFLWVHPQFESEY